MVPPRNMHPSFSFHLPERRASANVSARVIAVYGPRKDVVCRYTVHKYSNLDDRLKREYLLRNRRLSFDGKNHPCLQSSAGTTRSFQVRTLEP